VSSDKNEILFTDFGINYNNEPDLFKKGTVIFRSKDAVIPCPAPDLETSTPSSCDAEFYQRRLPRTACTQFQVRNCDIIGDAFWQAVAPVIGQSGAEERLANELNLRSLSLKDA
jgi:tRNA(His) guanylyltransferase